MLKNTTQIRNTQLFMALKWCINNIIRRQTHVVANAEFEWNVIQERLYSSTLLSTYRETEVNNVIFINTVFTLFLVFFFYSLKYSPQRHKFFFYSLLLKISLWLEHQLLIPMFWKISGQVTNTCFPLYLNGLLYSIIRMCLFSLPFQDTKTLLFSIE